MNFRDLSLIGTKLFMFVMQVLILIACIAYMQIIYNDNILPDKLVKETFPQTSCTIMSKELAKRGHLVHSYRANFEVTYIAKGANYETWTTGNGLDQAYFHEREPQEEALAQFNVGESYPCWYNPEHPQVAVLVLRHDWMSTLPLAPPFVIALISIYYIFKGIFQFFGFIALKLEENKKHFKR